MFGLVHVMLAVYENSLCKNPGHGTGHWRDLSPLTRTEVGSRWFGMRSVVSSSDNWCVDVYIDILFGRPV